MFRRSVVRHALQLVCLAVMAAGLARAQAADTYPSKVIRIIVPTLAATPPDIICRVIANEISRAEGWNVIVENRVGAIGMVAGADVLKQPADGYTIYAASLPISASPSLLPNMSYR